ncbi:MAG: hypothetical protein HKP30_14415 [Myxococcales bacterium]|nr:hypothetical protein [Myxococcales bacterium]
MSVLIRILKGLLGTIAVLALVVAALFVGARFHDGPLAIIPGGALESGPRVEAPVADWGFVADIEEIELQLLAQKTSRTTWIVAHAGRAFVPVSLAFPPGKSWHRVADEQGAAVLRIEGERYPVQLTRLGEDAEFEAIVAALAEKYTPPPGSDESGFWLFEVTSR